jgi:hypothetical protein
MVGELEVDGEVEGQGKVARKSEGEEKERGSAPGHDSILYRFIPLLRLNMSDIKLSFLRPLSEVARCSRLASAW